GRWGCCTPKARASHQACGRAREHHIASEMTRGEDFLQHSQPVTTVRRTRGTEMPISGTMHTGPGLAFVGCEISAGASAGAGGGSSQAHAHGRREVVVSGKRVKTIDVHAHCIVPDAAKLINHPLEAPGLLWSNIGDRLAQMDHTGVD